MSNRLYKEVFKGKYDGVIPALLIPPGGLSDGLNVRKVSAGGGWKPRKGCTLHNSTAIGHQIDSLHRYVNPKKNDYHFLGQSNSLLYEASVDPPTAGTSFGTSLGVTIGTTPGFGATVGERFFYADGSGVPISWGGDNPDPLGFVSWDNAISKYVDQTHLTTDGNSATSALVLLGASNKFYVLSHERLSGVKVVLGSGKNTNASVLTVKARRSDAWASVSSLSDGTITTGATFAKDGTISWTASGLDELNLKTTLFGYAYEFTWSAALSANIDFTKITVVEAAHTTTNKWNGVYNWITGAMFYDNSAGEYKEVLGSLTNESTSQYVDLSESEAADFLYIKTPEPLCCLGLGVVTDYENTAAILIDGFEYWSGSAWTSVGSFDDSTKDTAEDSSFGQTGSLALSDIVTKGARKRTLGGDSFSGYWYRISWAGALSADTRVFMIVYGTHPKDLPTYDGVVEFKARLLLWGDPQYPNRLRFSCKDFPDCFCGRDSGYTDAFGDETPILCALPFYNELIVWKENSVWLLEGYSPQTFGNLKIADTIGLASPQTARVVEAGYPAMNRNEPLSIALWQDTDGIYVLDGRKPRKISLPVDNFFNPEKTQCIAAASIKNRQAFIDSINNEYHFLLPAGELVYNYIQDEWYPPWERKIHLVCGLSFRGTDDRKYCYGANSTGLCIRLENDTTDKTTANVDEAIEHKIKTRAIAVMQDQATLLSFTLRRLWVELKSRVAGTIVTVVFKNMESTGTTEAVPEAISMIGGDAGLTTNELTLSYEGCSCFEVEFSLTAVDQEMEIWSMLYELDARGLLDL